MEKEFDVVVVGAGPAGCSTARSCANAGLKTLLVEEHNSIGEPVQCAEGIGSYLIPFLPFKIPNDLLFTKIEGMAFWADDIEILRTSGVYKGYTVSRKKLDQWLASQAEQLGSKILTNTKLVGLDVDKEFQTKNITLRTDNSDMCIRTKVLVGADGTNSTVSKYLGVSKEVDNAVGEVLSFELENINLIRPHFEQLFFGCFAPDVYAYIFPISKHRANVGVATMKHISHLENLYSDFIELPVIREQLRGGKVVSEKSGKAPIKSTTEKWLYGNNIFVGDAANHTMKPFVEGILPAIIFGEIAGKFVSFYLKKQIPLDTYEIFVRRKFESLIHHSENMADTLFDSDIGTNADIFNLGAFSGILNAVEIRKFATYNRDHLKSIILKRRDSSYYKLRRLLIDFAELQTLKLRNTITPLPSY